MGHDPLLQKLLLAHRAGSVRRGIEAVDRTVRTPRCGLCSGPPHRRRAGGRRQPVDLLAQRPAQFETAPNRRNPTGESCHAGRTCRSSRRRSDSLASRLLAYINPTTPERPRDDRHTWTHDGTTYKLYWGDFHRHTDVSNCITANDGCVLGAVSLRLGHGQARYARHQRSHRHRQDLSSLRMVAESENGGCLLCARLFHFDVCVRTRTTLAVRASQHCVRPAGRSDRLHPAQRTTWPRLGRRFFRWKATAKRN